MKWLAAAVLAVVAMAAFMFALLAGSDPEGRGGPLVLAALVASVVAIVGAVTIIQAFP